VTAAAAATATTTTTITTTTTTLTTKTIIFLTFAVKFYIRSERNGAEIGPNIFFLPYVLQETKFIYWP
jgi:hypothetical protein